MLSALGETADRRRDRQAARPLQRRGRDVELRIPYRETIRKTASAQGRHKKQTGGSGQFADCWLRVEPNPGKGYEFVDEIVGGKIPRQFIPAIDKGVQNTMIEGVLAGYPMVDVKVAVFDGSYHAVDSNEMAFRTAARIGFRAAAEKADMVLLEPVATLTIDVPEAYAGAVMGDMSSRRGRILGMDGVDGDAATSRRSRPYAEVVHYSPILRSLTHGTGMLLDRDRRVRRGALRHGQEGHRAVREGEGRGPLACRLTAREQTQSPAPHDGTGLSLLDAMVPATGFEPVTFCSGGRRSILWATRAVLGDIAEQRTLSYRSHAHATLAHWRHQ